MALELKLRRNLSESSTLVRGLALRGVVDAGETNIVSVDIFYRFDDQDDMKPQYAGSTKPGTTFRHFIDQQKRPITYYAVGRTSKGLTDVTDLDQAEKTTYTPGVFDKTVATGLESLFSHTFTAGAEGGSVDYIATDGAGNYYNYLMPAGRFADGESIEILYQSESADILNSKIQKPYFGSELLGSFEQIDAGRVNTRIVIQRQGSTIQYSTTFLFDADSGPDFDDVLVQSDEITGIDPDTEDVEIKLIINQNAGGAGGVTISSGLGYKIPAPAENTVEYLIEGGEILGEGPDALTEE